MNQEVTTKQLDDLVIAYHEARMNYDAAKEALSILQTKKDDLEAGLITTLEKVNKTSYKVDGVGSVARREKYAVRVPATIEEKKELFDYIRAKGEEIYLTMTTINYQTLNSFYNAEMEAAEGKGESLTIPGLEAPTLSVGITFRKEK